MYKTDVSNRGADAFSRVQVDGELCPLRAYPIWTESDQVLEEVHNDVVLLKIIEDVNKDPELRPSFIYHNGVLLYEGKLVISAQSLWIPKLLQEFHSTRQGGHSGFYRTYRRIAANVYWIGMKGRIQTFVRECDTCQRQKYLASSPGGLLQPLPTPEMIWDEISMDFITGLPKSKGFEAVFVVVDRLSKYGHFISLKHPYTARTIAELFTKEVVRLHGMPKGIINDRDPIFVSNFWKEMFKLQGTQLKMRPN